jgi:outer membrane protein OmpA-like peptidoglycan-associated protein
MNKNTRLFLAVLVSIGLSIGPVAAAENSKDSSSQDSKKSDDRTKVVVTISLETPEAHPSESESSHPSELPSPESSNSHSSESEKAHPSESPSAHPSESHSSTPSPTPTVTKTAEPTPTPTVTKTAEPTPTPTVTKTAEPTPTPTVTTTASPTPTVTTTASPSPTPTESHSSSPSPSPSVSRTPDAPPAFTPEFTPNPEPSPTPSPSVGNPPGGANLNVQKPNTVNNPGPQGNENTGNPPTQQLSNPLLPNSGTEVLSPPDPKMALKFGYDAKGRVITLHGTLRTVVGTKKVVINQIVPISQSIIVVLPPDAKSAQIYVNGKAIKTKFVSGKPFTLPMIIGPKDKVQVRMVDAKGNVVFAPISYTRQPINLANVNFDFSASKITPAAKKILDEVIAVVKQHGFTTITLVGNTDSKTSKVFDNLKLSNDRSSAVLNYLKKALGSKIKITKAGVAAKQPIASNATSEGQAANRRVEISVS